MKKAYIPTKARLTSLSHYVKSWEDVLKGNDEGAKSIIAIEFPSMPDYLDLDRNANYDVSSIMDTPDGFHQYKWTEPFEIPFSFKVHSQSEYCQKGGLTLVELAAKLHALTLPLGSSSKGTFISAAPAPAEAAKTEGAEAKTATTTDQNKKVREGLAVDQTGFRNPPVACKFDLLWTGQGYGISCVGYVKGVKARLYGPFRTGPNGAYNIPTWAEYSFTFMHRPNHTNFFESAFSGANLQAYADHVRTLFYNSAELVKNDEGISYVGFGDS